MDQVADSILEEAIELYASDDRAARGILMIRADAIADEHGVGSEEETQARHLVGWVRDTVTEWPHSTIPTDSLTAHQLDQLHRALTRRIGILEGSPGTGKTFTSCVLIDALARLDWGWGAIALCAPTGKAANRLTEVLRTHGAKHNNPFLLRMRATTIHRLLEVTRNGHDRKGWGFAHDRSNPLPHKFIILDEASMLDTSLASSLFKALHCDAHVLLVGDPHQLPPVGHGCPLRDMIASGRFGHGKLEEIHRNSGAIVHACKNIKEGKPPGKLTTTVGGGPGATNSAVVPEGSPSDLPVKANWTHLECAEEDIPGVLRRVVLGKSEHIVTDEGLDYFRLPPVLTPTNEGSPISRRELNMMLDELAYNTPLPFPDRHPYRLTSPIICVKNTNNSSGRLIANGDVGEVIALRGDLVEVVFPDAEASTTFDVSTKERSLFEPAFALTGHKSQGSEWPVVVVVLDPSGRARGVCNREWIYTVASRAKEHLFTVGPWKVIKDWVTRTGLARRQTLLRERIERLCPPTIK